MPGSPAVLTDAIDRGAPSRRPSGHVVMRQKWRDLLFLHWPVPVEQLRPLIPSALDIDVFAGCAYVGLVPFTMTGVRPVWSPSIPPLSNFHETNVRTYVHFRGANPGVWFFSLDAANVAAVRIARLLWRLPYFYARMRLERQETQSPEPANPLPARHHLNPAATVRYSTNRLWPQPLPAACSVAYAPIGHIAPAEPATLEHFLVERYILYTGTEGRVYSGQVHHDPYPLQGAVVQSLEESLLGAAGITRGGEPPISHYSPGVDVDVYSLRPVKV